VWLLSEAKSGNGCDDNRGIGTVSSSAVLSLVVTFFNLSLFLFRLLFLSVPERLAHWLEVSNDVSPLVGRGIREISLAMVSLESNHLVLGVGMQV
jgi:hypothetical protein